METATEKDKLLPTEAKQEKASTSSASNDENHHKKRGSTSKRSSSFKGVRCNLKSFYDGAEHHLLQDVNVLDPTSLTMPQEDKFASKRHFCWVATMWFGGTLLASAVILLLLGHGIPPKNPVIGDKDGIELLSKPALAFNKALRICQLVGLALFCFGGVVTAGSLLLATLCPHWDERTTAVPDNVAVAVSCKDPPRVPMDVKVPVTEFVSSVQPALKSPVSSTVLLPSQNVTLLND